MPQRRRSPGLGRRRSCSWASCSTPAGPARLGPAHSDHRPVRPRGPRRRLRPADVGTAAARDRVGLADPSSLALPRWLQLVFGLGLLVPSLYTLWSVARYFGFRRALGADHFRASFRTNGLVDEGAFCRAGGTRRGVGTIHHSLGSAWGATGHRFAGWSNPQRLRKIAPTEFDPRLMSAPVTLVYFLGGPRSSRGVDAETVAGSEPRGRRRRCSLNQPYASDIAASRSCLSSADGAVNSGTVTGLRSSSTATNTKYDSVVSSLSPVNGSSPKART